MDLHKNKNGFTLVELLIVIVVIAILAAISIVAYSNIQQRARNSIRAQDITSIQKALELYRAEHGQYPPSEAPGANALPAGFISPYSTTAAYSYSVATDDSWMRRLRTSGFIGNIPKDPINDITHYYIYIAYKSHGSCKEPFYVLIARGWEGGTATMPANSQSLSCNGDGLYARWGKDGNQAVFSNLNHPIGEY